MSCRWIVLALGALLLQGAAASSQMTPSQSALVVAFEDAYDLSLLANTISDFGVETTLVVGGDAEAEHYEHLIDVEVVRVNVTNSGVTDPNARALQLCEAFVSNINIAQYAQKMQPTFVIFPAVRHDACLLPWTLSISSIPVIWARGHFEEFYVFAKTNMALPVHELNFIQSCIESLNMKYLIHGVESNYALPTLKMLQKKLPQQATIPLANLYSNVQLVLWGADPILRTNSAPLTQLIAEIGCHHCRGPQPLPADLQKELIEFRAGTIVVLLEKGAGHESYIQALAQKLPNDRQGLAIMWKNKNFSNLEDRPNNLIIHKDVDRQDIIGYPRARVVLCHCTDSEFLESSFHGTPMICFPRNLEEERNAQRARQLGFGHIVPRNGLLLDNLADLVKEVHESSQYREAARVVSLAIRDRSNHAMDRIQFWLGYTARHYGEGKNLLLPKKVSTYNETLQVIIGCFIGFFFAVILGLLFFLSTQFNETKKGIELKRKLKR